jgi:hypothetical protein
LRPPGRSLKKVLFFSTAPCLLFVDYIFQKNKEKFAELNARLIYRQTLAVDLIEKRQTDGKELNDM